MDKQAFVLCVETGEAVGRGRGRQRCSCTVGHINSFVQFEARLREHHLNDLLSAFMVSANFSAF